MKQILFILIGIASLQVQASHSHTPATYAQEYTTPADADKVRQAAENTDDETKTEKNFHDFIVKDVAAGKDIKNGATLHYTKFRDANKAFGVILNFISPAEERKKFDKTHKYKSGLIKVEWEENTPGQTVVKDGFARLKVTFKKKKTNYTVIFRQP